jgi:hypothetical protein
MVGPGSSATTPNRDTSKECHLAPNLAPKIVQQKTWTWSGSKDNYAKSSDLFFEVGMGNQKDGYGCADAGVEIQNARVLEVSVTAPPTFARLDANTFAGFFVDYHTAQGYRKRVALSIGAYSESRWTKTPVWGTVTLPNQFVNLGRQPRYVLDLKAWAPTDWDGTIWFTVSLQNTGKNTTVRAKLNLLW